MTDENCCTKRRGEYSHGERQIALDAFAQLEGKPSGHEQWVAVRRNLPWMTL